MSSNNLLFQASGILLVVGAIMPMWVPLAPYAPLCFGIGAAVLGGMQMLQGYDGRNITLRRLFRQQRLGGLLLIITAALMAIPRFTTEWLVGDEWKVTLAIAVVLEIYTAFRIPQELQKIADADRQKITEDILSAETYESVKELLSINGIDIKSKDWADLRNKLNEKFAKK